MPASANHLALSQLSKASVKAGGTWSVYAYQPHVDNYEYTYDGKAKKGSNFVVILVSVDDPRQYCQAQFRKNAKLAGKYDQVTKSIKHGNN